MSSPQHTCATEGCGHDRSDHYSSPQSSEFCLADMCPCTKFTPTPTNTEGECSFCGMPSHRYSPEDPEHEFDAVACVNALATRLATRLATVEAERDALRGALEAVEDKGCRYEEEYDSACLFWWPEDAYLWCSGCVATVALATLTPPTGGDAK